MYSTAFYRRMSQGSESGKSYISYASLSALPMEPVLGRTPSNASSDTDSLPSSAPTTPISRAIYKHDRMMRQLMEPPESKCCCAIQ